MPLHWLNFQELCVDGIFEQIFLETFRVDIRQKFLRLASVVENLVPNQIVFRVQNGEGFDPAVLSAFCDDTGELARLEEVKLEDEM